MLLEKRSCAVPKSGAWVEFHRMKHFVVARFFTETGEVDISCDGMHAFLNFFMPPESKEFLAGFTEQSFPTLCLIKGGKACFEKCASKMNWEDPIPDGQNRIVTYNDKDLRALKARLYNGDPVAFRRLSEHKWSGRDIFAPQECYSLS